MHGRINYRTFAADNRFLMKDSDRISKISAAAKYVLIKGGAMDIYHLVKILYFAEREHYANYGIHLLPDNFVAMNYGPVPTLLYDAIKIARTDIDAYPQNILASQLAKSFVVKGELLAAAGEIDMDELSRAEIQALDRSIAENKNKKFDLLRDQSHDIAWRTAWETKNNSLMNEFLIAKAGGASDDFIDYMRECREFERAFN